VTVAVVRHLPLPLISSGPLFKVADVLDLMKQVVDARAGLMEQFIELAVGLGHGLAQLRVEYHHEHGLQWRDRLLVNGEPAFEVVTTLREDGFVQVYESTPRVLAWPSPAQSMHNP
jgi:hypothetical protein